MHLKETLQNSMKVGLYQFDYTAEYFIYYDIIMQTIVNR